MFRVFAMLMGRSSLVIVADLDIERIAIHKPEADAPLVVDGDGVLPFSIIRERVQPIARRNSEIVQACRQVACHVTRVNRGGARRQRLIPDRVQ